jgi:hypothetical protein
MSGGGSGRDDSYIPTPAPVKPSKTGSGGGGGGAGGPDPCDIVEIVPLNSPQSAVIATLKVGDVLTVNLNRSGPNPVLEVLAFGGQRAGALTHRNHVRIINCIDAGRTYRAVVMSIRGGSVEVRVEPA